ncbi:MAG TPA: archease [Candidatus Binatia bacterium]|jgi:SHS2 domain-containing protein|nr:archease [Candidatus Binatia bacterium]
MADPKKYKTFSRSSELAVKISGDSQAELFANSGFALFDIMTQMDKVQDNEHLTLEVEGADRDDLMVNWMRELLYLYQGSSFLLKEVVVQEVKDTYIRGEVQGEKFDPDRHEMKREISAVSPQQGRMEKTGSQWTAQVILEL